MEKISFIIIIVLFANCSIEKDKVSIPSTTEVLEKLEIPEKIIQQSKLHYNPKISTWTLDGQPYSGYAVSYYSNDSLENKVGILNGKKQNESITLYPDGHYKFLANYHKGKLHGEKKSWSSHSKHILLSHLNYHLGKAHGVQKKWYSSGELFKVLNMNKGREEGLQKAYRKNGDLFANYEARNGRIFGLKRAALCFELENEIVQNAD